MLGAVCHVVELHVGRDRCDSDQQGYHGRGSADTSVVRLARSVGLE